MDWSSLYHRLRERESENVGGIVRPHLREALETADWLAELAEQTGVEFDALPAGRLGEHYDQQVQILVARHRQKPSPALWGSIQRIIYEYYGLSCDEIVHIELWRQKSRENVHPGR